eukprot:1158924-Pelagomonas_calceolata.AAC.15
MQSLHQAGVPQLVLKANQKDIGLQQLSHSILKLMLWRMSKWRHREGCCDCTQLQAHLQFCNLLRPPEYDMHTAPGRMPEVPCCCLS